VSENTNCKKGQCLMLRPLPDQGQLSDPYRLLHRLRKEEGKILLVVRTLVFLSVIFA
jgi:hypothetical protein